MPTTTRPFERFHFDLFGGKTSLPFNKEKYKYVLVVTDDYTRYRWAWALSRKSQAVHKLQWLWRSLRAKHPEFKPNIAYIHTDDAKEWQLQEFQEFIQEQGITLEISTPYNHEQNGVAERANRIIIEILRSLLIQSQLPDSLWPSLLPLALLHANMAPKPTHAQTGRLPTPFQELFGRPSPLYTKVRPCGVLV